MNKKYIQGGLITNVIVLYRICSLKVLVCLQKALFVNFIHSQVSIKPHLSLQGIVTTFITSSLNSAFCLQIGGFILELCSKEELDTFGGSGSVIIASKVHQILLIIGFNEIETMFCSQQLIKEGLNACLDFTCY